jgi:uncharacterized protein YrrD
MHFIRGAEVFASMGEKIGTLDRIVIDPADKEVTHIIVEKGFLFTEDKVIPIEMVDDVVEKRILLKEKEDEIEDLPDFKESHYIRLDQVDHPSAEADAIYWYPPVHAWWRTGGYVGRPMPQYVVKTEKNIPENSVALEEGAKVIAQDGEHVGDIERVFTESQDHRSTHFVVSEGFILKERKLVPTPWIAEVAEDEIHLSVKSGLVDRLPEYQPTTPPHFPEVRNSYKY